MATELLARAWQFLSRSDFESLLSGFRSGSFLDHFEWSGKHGRKCCLESDPRIRFEADHVAGSRRSKRATLGPERAGGLLRSVCRFNTTLKAGAQDFSPCRNLHENIVLAPQRQSHQPILALQRAPRCGKFPWLKNSRPAFHIRP